MSTVMSDDEQGAHEDSHEPVPGKKSYPSTIMLYSRKDIIESSKNNIILDKEVDGNQSVLFEAMRRGGISDLFECW